MAIARGAGTEILRSAHFEYIAGNTTTHKLIFGVQHHIYTVLSIICFAVQDNGPLIFSLRGYDDLEGTTAQEILLFKTPTVTDTDQTFVWNDKFSFNGFEPTNYTGPLDDATKQDAVADQGSSVAQIVEYTKNHNNDKWEIHTTYIDQNNA
jgi:hypothetical protein|tara:strand:+ start:203 stop:655 length:453 start_codon:yes stop_codon:yes gene_type:complete